MVIMEEKSVPDLRLFYRGHAQVRDAIGSPGTRRCLFGSPDPAETSRFCREELRREYDRQKKKWNFDFEKDTPLEGGRYQWERVQCPLPEQSHTEAVFGPEERVQERVAPEPAAPTPAPCPAPADRSSQPPVRQPSITGECTLRRLRAV